MDLFNDLSTNQMLLTFGIILIVYMVVNGFISELVIGFIAIWLVTCVGNGTYNFGTYNFPRPVYKSQRGCIVDKKLQNTEPHDYEMVEPHDYELVESYETIGDIYSAASDAMEKVKEDIKEQNKIPLTNTSNTQGVYSENSYKENTFPELSGLGDNRLVTLQKHRGNKNREAMDRMARTNKYTNIGYFKRELDNTANSRWWDDESLESEF
jgi:hypothetical protein